ncbi:TrkH family potassium uptake protein [Thermohalobaculum xanthum]|nr:TrkH family potassium uptake protein [Thermohalobaculum xanthum]
MMVPAGLDWWDNNPNWHGVLLAGFLAIACGVSISTATRGSDLHGLTRRQAFMLTVLVWAVLPVFGALPFVFGAPRVSFTDGYFEAMSALTTTGATVFTGLADAPRGMLLWRGMMQWFGGVGIVVVAIVFMPALRIGGMQFFRSESFDLSGDIVPRATEIAGSLAWIYVGLTAACGLGYSLTGMSGFDALVHSMTTLSTGGMGNYDTGFEHFSEGAHYVGVLFMILAAVPFIRFIQIMRGAPMALWRDSQARAFVAILGVGIGVVTAWLVWHGHHLPRDALREASFNLTSVMTGTGYASDAYDRWGGFAVTIFFVWALIGGCSGSTTCSGKVFRYQILYAALVVQIKRIHSPNGVFPLHYQGRPVEPEVVSSIMGFFFVFVVCLSIWSILLSLMGYDTLTAISGSVATLGNVGPGLGPVIGPSGNFAPLGEATKWLLSFGMLLGRLEFLSVLVLFTPLFWRK